MGVELEVSEGWHSQTVFASQFPFSSAACTVSLLITTAFRSRSRFLVGIDSKGLASQHVGEVDVGRTEKTKRVAVMRQDPDPGK